MSEKLKRFDIKLFAVDTVYDILGSVLYALGIYTFASSANFAPGGIAGLSIIINHFFPILPIGMCTLIFNIPVIILCVKALGKTFFLKSVKSMVISALIMDTIFPLFPRYMGDRILAALFAGILSGAGLALIYSRGSSTGGTDFIIFSLKKYFPHLSIGTITLLIDGCVILLGGVVFKEIEAVLFGIMMTIASTIVIDKITYGFGSSKMTMIITTHGNEIASRISSDLERGSTLINAIGTFTGESRQILMCACNKTESFDVKRIVHDVDPKAIIMMSTLDEAYGYGFKNFE